jgi:hypothetical protein
MAKDLLACIETKIYFNIRKSSSLLIGIAISIRFSKS